MPTIVVAPWLYTLLAVTLVIVNVVVGYLGPYKDTIPQWVGLVLGGLSVVLAALLNVMRQSESSQIRIQAQGLKADPATPIEDPDSSDIDFSTAARFPADQAQSDAV